jgi:hypothetical protein
VELHYAWDPIKKLYSVLSSPRTLKVIYIPTLKLFGDEDLNGDMEASKALRSNNDYTELLTWAFNTAINNDINHLYIPPIGMIFF